MYAYLYDHTGKINVAVILLSNGNQEYKLFPVSLKIIKLSMA